jgi:hypothetical protein
MIKANHPIREWMLKFPGEYDCKKHAFGTIKHFLAEYNWHLNRSAWESLGSGKCGGEFYAIYNDSEKIVGGIFVAWTTTSDGRVRFIAEIL